MGDSSAYLSLDIVTDNRQAGTLELTGPFGSRGNKDRDTVYKTAAGVDSRLSVELRSLLRAHRQVIDDCVGLGVFKHLYHIDGYLAFFNWHQFGSVLVNPVQSRPARNRYVQLGDFGKHSGVIRFSIDRLGHVFTDFVAVNVKRRHNLDVVNVVAAKVNVHNARDKFVILGISIIIYSLNQ